MTANDKIAKAKAKLILDHPYFGTLAAALKLKSDPTLLTFSSDGESITFNPEYVEKLTAAEVEFMLANGAMHTVLKHQHRASGRTQWLWQTATDYVVNAMLVNNGLQAPVYANYESKFDGMYAEEVYELLRAEMNSDEEFSSQEQHNEQIRDADDIHAENLTMHEEKSASDRSDNIQKEQDQEKQDQKEQKSMQNSFDQEELSETLKEDFEQIFQKLKRQGNLPKNLEIVIPEYFSHTVGWRELLYGYIASYAKSTYAFVPPNMKYLYRGIYLPSLSSDLLRIVIAIDTSGSVDEALLKTFLGEVTSIMQAYPNYEIDLITVDAKIQSHQCFFPGESLNYQVSGGGGTDFRPVFQYIEQNLDYPTLLLYFTDGMGTFPEYEPHYDLLWIMPEEKNVPFGEVIVLEN